MRISPFLPLIIILLVTCSNQQIKTNSSDLEQETNSTLEVVLMSEVEWEQLNPKRGINSPKAATLWGDRTGPGPSGFLLKPVDGFSSPPHFHSANYHGVVISGTIHNAEPSVEEVYLPKGSFWIQPARGVHITACKGACLAYIEIEGAFDVLPAEKAIINTTKKSSVLHSSDITWIDLPGFKASFNVPKLAVLWGKLQDDLPSGTLVKLPPHFSGKMYKNDTTFHAVLIQGRIKLKESGETNIKILEPSSYFSSKGSVYQISCEGREDCILYLRSEGMFDFFPARLN